MPSAAARTRASCRSSFLRAQSSRPAQGRTCAARRRPTPSTREASPARGSEVLRRRPGGRPAPASPPPDRADALEPQDHRRASRKRQRSRPYGLWKDVSPRAPPTLSTPQGRLPHWPKPDRRVLTTPLARGAPAASGSRATARPPATGLRLPQAATPCRRPPVRPPPSASSPRRNRRNRGATKPWARPPDRHTPSPPRACR